MNFNQRPHQLQKIKRPKFYGARKPAYLNLALQHCPTSYWSSPDFWRKTIEKKIEIQYWRKTRWIWNSQKIRRSDLCPCCKRLRLFVKMNTTAAIVISFLNASSLRCKRHAFRSEWIGVSENAHMLFCLPSFFTQPALACVPESMYIWFNPAGQLFSDHIISYSIVGNLIISSKLFNCLLRRWFHFDF